MFQKSRSSLICLEWKEPREVKPHFNGGQQAIPWRPRGLRCVCPRTTGTPKNEIFSLLSSLPSKPPPTHTHTCTARPKNPTQGAHQGLSQHPGDSPTLSSHLLGCSRLPCFLQLQTEMRRARLEGAAGERGATLALLGIALTTGTWNRQGLNRKQLGEF